MTKHLRILLGFLIQTLCAYSQKENWDVYMAQYEKGVGSTVVNMALKSQAPVKRFPFLLKTGVKLIICNKDGLPEKAEFEKLYQISDRMKSIIDSTLENISSGTFSYQCERTDYYYVTDTTGIRKRLEAAYKKEFSTYQYSVTIKVDENWEAYLTFLYPNEETFEYMTNEKVILNLIKEGDDLSKPRQVDHWLYFKTEAGRNDFIAYAIKQNYKVENREILENTEFKYKLQISKTDIVQINSITDITMMLKKQAEKLNGKYDGWETFVVREK